MHVVHRRLSASSLLTLSGELDSITAAPLGEELRRIRRDEGVSRMVLNMRRVRFVNSTGVGMLLKAREACRSGGGDLVLSQAPRAVRDVLEALGLDRHFTQSDSDQGALIVLEGPSPRRATRRPA